MGQPPLWHRLKEWGDVADVWSKFGVRVVPILFGFTNGDAIADIAQKAVGG